MNNICKLNKLKNYLKKKKNWRLKSQLKHISAYNIYVAVALKAIKKQWESKNYWDLGLHQKHYSFVDALDTLDRSPSSQRPLPLDIWVTYSWKFIHVIQM